MKGEERRNVSSTRLNSEDAITYEIESTSSGVALHMLRIELRSRAVILTRGSS